MAIIVTVLRANDSTVTHADRAPNLMSAVAMAAAARKGMNIGILSGLVVGKEKAPWTVRSRALSWGGFSHVCGLVKNSDQQTVSA